MKAAVVGAGPAGCFAAKALSKEYDVTVYEEHVQQPVQCAGLLSASGLRRLGVPAGDFVLNNVSGARVYSPLGRCIELEPGDVKAYVVDRSIFDEFLLDDAVSGGATVVKERVTEATESVVRTSSGESPCDLLVLATGTNYQLPRRMGVDTPKRFLVGAQYELEVDCDPRFVEVHFTVPGFFAWVIPVEGYARVGLAAYSNPMPHLKRFLGALKKEGRVKRNPRILNESYGTIPVYRPRMKADYGSIRLVGDAAGHVKASTGGGVILGGLAAQHVADADYERGWRREVGRELLLHLMVHRFFSRLTPEHMDSFLELIGEYRQVLESGGDMDAASKTLSCFARNPRFLLKSLTKAPGFAADILIP